MSLNTLLGQEIARFNALSEDEKLEGTKAKGVGNFRESLRQVRSIGDYDRLMARLHSELADGVASKRPVLFEVAAPDEWADLDATIPAVDSDYHLRANPAYNTRVLRFQPDRKAATINRELGQFEVHKDGLYFRPDRIKLRIHDKNGTTLSVAPNAWRKLLPRDEVETADFLGKDFRPQMIVAHSARGALIGRLG
jgi:hypothetical protein